MSQSIGPATQKQGPDSGLVSKIRAPTLPYSMQGLCSPLASAIHDIQPFPTASKDNSEGGVLPMNPAPLIPSCFHKLQSTPSSLSDIFRRYFRSPATTVVADTPRVRRLCRRASSLNRFAALSLTARLQLYSSVKPGNVLSHGRATALLKLL